MNPPVKFIYFDIGGVLLRVRPFFEDLAEKTGVKTKTLIKSWGQFDAVSCRGLKTGQQVWQEYVNELNISNLESVDFVSAFTETATVIQETHKLANQLENKFPIGLLSNIQYGVMAENLKRNKLPDINYAAVIESCAIGYVKPEPEIYQIAQYSANTPPKHILFIDDSIKYVTAAKDQGWQGITFNENNPGKSIQEIKAYLKI